MTTYGSFAFYLFFLYKLCSKSSVLLGMSLTVPLMVACLSVAIPIWIRNGYQFWIPHLNCTGSAGNDQTPGTKEVSSTVSSYQP